MFCKHSKDIADLFAVRLAVAPYRNDHDLSWGQPQRPGPNTERTVKRTQRSKSKTSV